jgi:hypothetical protein
LVDFGERQQFRGQFFRGFDDFRRLQAAIAGIDLGDVGTLVVVIIGFVIGGATTGDSGRGS